MTYPPELPIGNGDRFPSREEILKAILAAGMLADGNACKKTVLHPYDNIDFSFFARAVNAVYVELFEENNHEA